MCLKKIFDGLGREHFLESGKIGDLTGLQTEARGNLVEAVNEIAGKIPKMAEEEWVFTLEDGTTVTRKVAVME